MGKPPSPTPIVHQPPPQMQAGVKPMNEEDPYTDGALLVWTTPLATHVIPLKTKKDVLNWATVFNHIAGILFTHACFMSEEKSNIVKPSSNHGRLIQ